MGGTRFNPTDYKAYATATAGRTMHDYKAHSIKDSIDPKDSFNPKVIKVRESLKSDLNPHPTPVIVGLDVTGSMAVVVEAMRKGLGTLFEEIIKRSPVSDPHVLAMAIGDFDHDRSPVQATQFEADPVTIGKQIEELHLERGGGGNDHESYMGPWYFALMRTKCDAFNEGRKGYIFTVGDEQPQLKLTKSHIERWFGDQPKQDYSASELLAAVERNWHVFHLMVEEGSHMRLYKGRVENEWREVLGQRAINLADHNKMAEVIVSLIEVTEGRDKDTVTKTWSSSTAMVVAEALKNLPSAGSSGIGAGPVPL